MYYENIIMADSIVNKCEQLIHYTLKKGEGLMELIYSIVLVNM